MLLKRRSDSGDEHILVDIGKTFREAGLAFFQQKNVEFIQSIILTHPHCDAFVGLDDVREISVRTKIGQPTAPVNLYADEATIPFVKHSFPYLFPELRQGKGPLSIGTLRHCSIEHFKPFTLSDLEITPIPLHHGDQTICLGYVFSQHESATQLVYFSDFRHQSSSHASFEGEVPEITEADYNSFSLFIDPAKSLDILKKKRISVMILDCLRMGPTTPSHAVYNETLKLIKSFEMIGIVPQNVYFTGMDCSLDFTILAKQLVEEVGAHVQPGYDGLEFRF